MRRVVVLAVVLGALVGPGVPAGPAGASPGAVGPGAVRPGAVAPGAVVPRGAFGWPLAGVDPTGPPLPGAPGTVARRFLPPPTPYGRGHRGVDLAAPPGTTVLAAGAGTVAFAGLLAGRGVVSVRHAGGLRTTYEPVVATVAAGQAVGRGTPLGALAPGHRGCGADTCLHWGLRRAAAGTAAAAPAGPGPGPGPPEEYLDPLLLVGHGRVRLLPLAGP